jgi:hypothetical protein
LETRQSRGSSRCITAASSNLARDPSERPSSARRAARAFEQCDLELFDKQPFAAELRQGAIQNLVATRRHAEQLYLSGRVSLYQDLTHMFSLPQCEGTFARRDDDARRRVHRQDPVDGMTRKWRGESSIGSLCFMHTNPLNHLQVELIKRHRAGITDERVKRGIHLMINGISAGLRNTG